MHVLAGPSTLASCHVHGRRALVARAAAAKTCVPRVDMQNAGRSASRRLGLGSVATERRNPRITGSRLPIELFGKVPTSRYHNNHNGPVMTSRYGPGMHHLQRCGRMTPGLLFLADG